MNDLLHDPYRQSTLLLQALAPDKMRIAFLLGAGCPVSISVSSGEEKNPLIPDIQGLTKKVSNELMASEKHKDNFDIILKRLSRRAQECEAPSQSSVPLS